MRYVYIHVKTSVHSLASSSSPHIPPNFLLPSPSSAFSVPPLPFLHTASASSSSSSSSLVDEMARRKRSPKNITRNWQATSQITAKPDRCQICYSQLAAGIEPKKPKEGQEYFIENDGTLTIKNGVCPRNLALSLFAEVGHDRSKYENLVGENLVEFLLNLYQIVDKHREICPGEKPTDFLAAREVLKIHGADDLVELTNPRKRSHELIGNIERVSLVENLQALEKNKLEASDEDIPPTIVPENFLHTPSEALKPQRSSLPKERNLSSILSEPSAALLSTPHHGIKPEYNGSAKRPPSESGSAGGSSRVSSPTPSLSSVTSGFSMSEAAKQMSNTKRGSKILPVASGDGQTCYQCPVCGLELSNDHELTVHIRSHNSSGQQAMPNTCTICGKTLSSQSSLDRHMLVHSGERPFKCKICDMSFTTNGNMHRHSRIHEKNGTAPPRPIGRSKQNESKGPSKESLMFREDKSMGSSPGGHRQPQTPSLTPEYANDKMGLFSSPQQHEQSAAFLQQYYRLMFPFNAPHHPAFPFPHLLQDPTARMAFPYMQAMMSPLSGESPAKRARFMHPFGPPLREPSPDLRTQQKFNCTECSAVFKNQFSLDSHMESHVIVDEKLEAEGGSACKKCKIVAKSEESLHLHMLTHHKVKENLAEPDGKKSPTSSSPSSSTRNSSSPTSSANTGDVGFQALGFADISTKKFPLVAKAFCENNPNAKGIRFPVFKCQKCDKEFPVESAKNLHEASHVPEEYTICPKCDCHFADPSRLQGHMQKHVADIKFEKSAAETCEEVAESLTQNYFLAQFGLIAKEDNGQDLAGQGNEVESSMKDDVMLSEDEASKVINSDNEEDDRSESSKISQPVQEKMEGTKLSLKPSIFLHPKATSSQSGNSGSSAATSGKPSQGQSQVNPNLLPSVLNSRSPTPSADSDGDPNSQDSPIEVLDRSLPPMFPCKYCDMVLSTPKDLKYHQRTHKNTPQFLCKVCNYSSSDKSTLMRHMRTHSGERPYACRICDYSFTTKANCERHLRQKHGLEKDQLSDKLVCNKYIIANRKTSPSSTEDKTIGLQQDSLCKSCGVDFFSGRGLQQHLIVSPNCRTGYMCKKCKTTFPSWHSVQQHFSRNHMEIPPQMWDNYISAVEKPSNTNNTKKAILSTPPPAHSKRSSIASALASPSLDQVVVKQEPKFPGYFDTLENPELLERMKLMKQNREGLTEPNHEKPLDFSKQQKKDASLLYQQPQQCLNLSRSSSVSLSEDDQSLDDVPMDLTVSRPSHSSPWAKGQGQKLTSQSAYGFSRQVKEEPKTPTKHKLGSNKSNNSNNNNNNIPFFLENSGQPPHRSDGNNNQLSPLFTVNHNANTGNTIATQLSPFRPTSAGSVTSKSELPASALSPHTVKHPAFPAFLPMMPPYSSMIPSAAAQNLQALQGHPALSAAAQKLAFIPGLHPSLLGSAGGIASGTPLPGIGGATKTGTDDKSETAGSIKSTKGLGNLKETKEAGGSKKNMLDKSGIENLERVVEEKSNKESSCESDSSCELASVNKILDATDAQNFQDFLVIPETEDEQDNKSESVDSEEDSNLSLENMYSRSQSLNPGSLLGSRPSKSEEGTAEEGKTENPGGPSMTVNMALIGNSIPAAIREKALKEEACFSDPSNMSEQAIAALIEKVSQENVSSPAKKKRNSYADSPHKFSCPYCPRCFPWLSSLNRHLLTHTGQKPFKCPRCPVTFSTKSNRERHLIRKHNVNMLDPASRSTMDRPYKCHLCVFSSFSTQSNLIKHYKDRHNNISPPPRILEAGDKALSDGEGDDSLLNGDGPSYEDEEEFNTLAEMRGGLSDKDIMLQNYAQDSDSNHSGSNISLLRDPHKKRNTILGLNPDEDAINAATIANNINKNNVINLTNLNNNKTSIMALPVKAAPHLTSRPGIDDTVLTDTMKNFLDKSVRQALEDSHRRAMEEGSKFVITPAIERHLRRLPNNEELEIDLSVNQPIQCSKCGLEFPSHKLLMKHIKQEHSCEPPFKCYLCEMSFSSRVECLQHQEQSHQADWAILKEKNEIGNVQVFATRLDKMIEKLCKKGKEILDKQDKEVVNGDIQNADEMESDEKAKDKDNGDKNADDKTSSKEEKDEKDNEEVPEPGVLQDVLSTDYLQRKVFCSLCPKRFWSLQDLRRHMRSHTGEQPYRCDICFQKFTLKHSMNRHKAKHHAGVKDSGLGGMDVASDDEGSASDASGKPRTRSSQAKGMSALSSKMKLMSGTGATISGSDSNAVSNGDKNNNSNENDKVSTNDLDMLHNLLGVESSTIDQIFESKDSAASLLGV